MTSSINGGSGSAITYWLEQVRPDRAGISPPPTADGEAARHRPGPTTQSAGSTESAPWQVQPASGAGSSAGFQAQQYAQSLLAANDNGALAHARGVAVYQAAAMGSPASVPQDVDLYLPSLASGHRFDLLV